MKSNNDIPLQKSNQLPPPLKMGPRQEIIVQ